MKYILMLVFIGLQAVSLASDADKDGRPLILFETKIYRVDGDATTDKSETNKTSQVLEWSPSLVARAGETASIEIAMGEQADDEKIVMRFISDANATTFDVKLELLNGDNTTISHIEDSAIDTPLKFSAELNDVTRLFTLNTSLVGDDQMGEAVADASVEYDESACGRVSVFRRPPVNERYYRSAIVEVNDNNVDTKKTTHQLPPGKNTIKVYPFAGSYGGGGGRVRFRGKDLEIDVKPNMTYHIGAKFNSEKRYRTRDQEDWDPVVWRVTQQSCEL